MGAARDTPLLQIVRTAAVWLALAACPLFLDLWNLSQFAQLMSYGIFAMGLAFIWGQVGMLSFGQAIFFGAGGYVMAVVSKGMVPGLPDSGSLGLLGAMVIPGVIAFAFGQLLFRGAGLSGAYFAIVTLSAAVIVERAVSHMSWLGGFNGLLGIPPLQLGWGGWAVDLLDPVLAYYALLVAALAVYALLLWLERSRLGTVLRAVRDNDVRTGYFGYEVAQYKVFAFAVSGAVSGLAGALFVTQFGFASPALIGFALSTEVLIWVALGGKEVLLAGFLGALLVRTVEGILSEQLGQLWLLVLGVLFVVSVVFLPRGLLGWLLPLPAPRRTARD
jgi:branched-chain amino acid transport system permease protein/urea transport system permease protein